MPRRRRSPLTVAVGDAGVHEAACLYQQAFDTPPPVPDEGGWLVSLTPRVSLRVIAGEPELTEWYAPGRTPRLELQVDDVPETTAHLVALGFCVRMRQGTRYAQLIDPYGHLWALIDIEDLRRSMG